MKEADHTGFASLYFSREQEIQDRNVEVKHGRIVAVGRKHNAVEVTKGPVIVKVLDMDAAPPMSGNVHSR